MSGEPPLDLRALERQERLAQWAAFLAVCASLAWALNTWALLGLAVAAALLAPLAARRRVRGGPRSDLLVAAAGLLSGIPLGLAGGEPAPGLAAFLLVAQAGKLLAPGSPRDIGLAHVVGIVLLGVAAAEGVEPTFGLLLLLAAGLALWAMTRHARQALVQELSAPGRPLLPGATGGPAPSSGLRAALGSGRSALVLAACTGLIFFCFPRLGPKFLPSRRQGVERLSGFTDEVGLDDIGKIKRSDQLAFRVEPAGRLLDVDGPYWRGTALDRYDGVTWKRAEGLKLDWELDVTAPGQFLDRRFVRPPGDPIEATVYLEPIGSRYLFGPGAIEEVAFKTAGPRGVRRDIHGGMTLQQPAAIALAYRVRCWPEEVPDPGLRPNARALRRKSCLFLPEAVDRERMRRFSSDVLRRRRVPQDAAPSVVARALSEHLERNYTYSLEGTRTPGTEPVEDFLFQRRTGHCEVFASALAVLLRSVDIPSRLVTGFRGGDRNDWSGTWTVRQREAHAWVEALCEGERWVRLDPTPAAPESARGAFVETIVQLGDWLELRWFQDVIAFDAYDQRNFLFWLEERLRTRLAELGAPSVDPRLVLGAGLAAALGAVAAVWLWVTRRRGGAAARAPLGSAAVRRLLRALRRHGLEPAPGETLLELSRRAEARLGAPEVPAAVPAYYAGRFGGRPPAEEPLLAIAAALEARPAGYHAPGEDDPRGGTT